MMLPDTRNSVTLLERAQDSPIPNAWEFLEVEVCSSGGMVLKRENWFTGRKTLYSVGGSWMNEYGAMGELYWQRKTEVLGDKRVPVPLCTPQIQNGLPLNYIYISLRTMVVGNKSTTRVFSTKSKFIYLWCHFHLALGKNEDQGLGVQIRWSRSLRGRSRNLIEKGASQDHDSSGVGGYSHQHR